ncbi:MAG: HAD family hydrolase, partial [Candidatus Altiarchaeota archaeon]|nr:HAD family hydrolase [Candidatus Altiarchaeota archaeon]
LVDTFDLIYESFNKALEENKKRVLTKGEFKEYLFGKPVDSTLPELIGVSSREEVKKILKDFERHWFMDLEKVKIFKHVLLTLNQLKLRGSKLGVVSTSPRGVIRETLKTVGIYELFDVLIGEEDVQFKKPHHEPVSTALKMIDTPPGEAIFVGDTVYDMMAGKEAGCYTVLLLNGHNKDVLASFKPDKTITSVKELLELT